MESIGSECFENTAIKEIVIPKSVTHIGSYAFPEKAVTTRPADYYTENILIASMVK